MAHLILDGTGDYATSPDSAAIDITGDIDIRIWAAANDWSPSAAYVFVARREATETAAIQLISLATGKPQFIWWDSGGTSRLVDASSFPPFTDGAEHGLRVTLDVDDGAGGHVARFYTTTDSHTSAGSATWTQLGTDLSAGAFTTSIRATNDRLSIGAIQSGTAPFAGKFYRVQILDGIDGTLVFDGDPSDPNTWNAERTAFVEKANGATVTLQGDAALVGGGFPLLLLGVG